MKESLKERFQQPLSLKWKWGLFTFIAFAILFIILLALTATFYRQQQTNQYVAAQQVSYTHFEKLARNRGSVHTSQDLEEFAFMSEEFTDEAIIIRLLDSNDNVMYESENFLMSHAELTEQLSYGEENGQTLLYASFEMTDDRWVESPQQVQYIVLTAGFEASLASQHHRFYSMLFLGLVLIALIAFILSRHFLRPLTYLINSLDLVEEENLSDIRMRKPSSQDEWSDLSLHLNRLLDKIDHYVTNQKQFVEDVSHELRTPVAIVEGHLKLLNRWGKDDPEVLDESISASLQEIQRMKELVQEMLDLSRADHVDVDYKDEITEIYSTTRQVFENFKMIHPTFNFFLDDDQQDNLPLYVRMYRNHYEQVLIILLDNAVKYSLNRLEIHISISQGMNTVEIAVQDFGEGMSEEDKERVFGRFYRVDKARSREKGGNGLGLSIAKELINGYRGDIRVESSLGNGSIFYIELPILADQMQIEKSKAIAEAKRKNHPDYFSELP